MKAGAFWQAIELVLASPCAAATSQDDKGPVRWGCNDLVVVGRITDRTLESTDILGDIGIRRYTLTIGIKRVLHGQEERRAVTASAIEPSLVVRKRDLLIVLRPAPYSSYTIRTAAPVRGRQPRLAPSCA